MAYDPTDGELTEYIARRLGHIGGRAIEPHFIAEVIAENRDLWVMLFRIDHDLDALDLDELRFANPS